MAEPSAPGRRGNPRRRWLALIVVGAVCLAVGAWIATLLIESPREAVLNAEPPAPSLITVAAEKRVVGEEIITRGQVTASQTVEAVGPLTAPSALRRVVSGRLPKVGDSVAAGGVVVEISGRPIIALQGDVPAFRDLTEGDVGPDVQRLNAALAALAPELDPESSTYSPETQQAVDALYTRAGYASPSSLPAGEVLFVSALPASIVQVSGVLGGDAAEASVQIASGELRITTTLTAAESQLVQTGAEVVLSSEVLGESAPATVKADSGAIEISPDEPLPSSWAGQDVKVRVVSAVTDGEVLAVPIAAIVANGSGETEVMVVRPGATTITDAEARRVRVTVGASGAGWAEITALDGEAIAEGDHVQLSGVPQQ